MLYHDIRTSWAGSFSKEGVNSRSQIQGSHSTIGSLLFWIRDTGPPWWSWCSNWGSKSQRQESWIWARWKGAYSPPLPNPLKDVWSVAFIHLIEHLLVAEVWIPESVFSQCALYSMISRLSWHPCRSRELNWVDLCTSIKQEKFNCFVLHLRRRLPLVGLKVHHCYYQWRFLTTLPLQIANGGTTGRKKAPGKNRSTNKKQSDLHGVNQDSDQRKIDMAKEESRLREATKKDNIQVMANLRETDSRQGEYVHPMWLAKPLLLDTLRVVSVRKVQPVGCLS